MSEILIRKAVKSDCARMLELVHELAQFERASDQVTVNLEDLEENGFGDRPLYWALVAEVQGMVVAFALYYIRYSTWKGRRMYLEDLLVTEAHRGKKIGSLLFDALIEEARKKKFTGIAWQVLNWNEPAMAFYKRYNAAFDDEWINCAIEEPFAIK